MFAAVADLTRKFQWIPHFYKLPFIFALAITRTSLQMFEASSTGRLNSVFVANLEHIEDKWNCIVPTVNISRVLLHFIRNGISCSAPLNLWVNRGPLKSIRLGLCFVEVKYDATTDTGRQLFNKLLAFYNGTKDVSHLESRASNCCW